MKLYHFTITLIVCCLLTAPPLWGQTAFWSEDFSDQSAFETTWTNGGTNDGAEVWSWSDNPNIATFGGQPDFGATTAENGFILFNSDANGENEHDVTITSPAIDASDYGTVFLRCENQYGYFSAPSASIAEVGVSIDGENFTYYEILAEVEQNILEEALQIVVLEIPEAANQPEVYLQFRWRGFFEYAWKIDDISLSDGNPTPANELVFREPRLALNFATPVSQIDTVTMAGIVRNIGMDDQSNVLMEVAISSDNGDAFTATRELGTVEAGTADTVFYEESFVPSAMGDYTLTYTVTQDEEDAAPQNNSIATNFLISEDLFAKDDGNIVSATQPGDFADELWEIGNLYFVPNPGFEAIEATFSVFSENDVHQGQAVTLFLYKVEEDDDPEDFTDDDLMVVGFATHEFTDEESFDLVTVELMDLEESTPGVPLEAGAEYFLTVQYTQDMWVPYSPLSYIYDVATVVKDGEWFLGGFGPGVTALTRMRIREIQSAANEPELADAKIQLFPNPASETVRIDLALESTSQTVDIRITDAGGSAIQSRRYNNVRKESFSFDVRNWPAGVYFLHLRTTEGVKSQKLIVR